jgi:hypothetical protein
MDNKERKSRILIMRMRLGVGESILFVLVISFAALMCSCGIESYPYLAPPKSNSIKEPLYGVEREFRFGNNPENNSEYLYGYEVYYKFYGPERDNTELENDQDAISNNPTKTKLESLNYHRLYAAEDVTAMPLISIPEDERSSDFYIYIDFSLLGGEDKPYPVSEYLDSSLDIARYISVDNSESKQVVSFLPGDFDYTAHSYSDFSSDVVDTDTNTFSMVLYALTYGKYDVIYDIYSDPVFLGRIQLTTE